MAKFLGNYLNGKWVETGRTFATITSRERLEGL